MKKLMVVMAAMAFVVVMAGGAWAANGDVNVNATVNSKCTVTSGDTESFGAIDPLNAAASVNPEILVKCTKGSTITPTCTSTSTASTAGGDLKNGASTSTIAYTIDDCDVAYQTGSTTTGFSATGDKVNLTVSLAANAAQDALAGVHSDIIVVTVAP